jgi:hypothetical protein
MAINTITEPSADTQQVDMYNRRMRRSNVKVLETDRKYAVCLIALHSAVNQPGDYGALKAAIEGVTGIQEAELLVDGQAPSSIPEGKQLRMVVEAHLRLDDAPEV